MENKVLVNLEMPEINCSFDVFIPVNEVIWKVKKMLIKSATDITGAKIDENSDYLLVNKISGEIYKNNDIVINTSIRNSTSLYLLSTI